ncbi:MAG: hypothetical protein SF051_02430 [Elusimicrobiota bacterium]|nr:hypothetical protein [Elusimicrobiota bacterium]
MKRLLPLLLLPLLAGCASSPKTKVRQWAGNESAVPAAGFVAIRDADAWRSLWEKIERDAPAVDLETHFAVAVFLGDKRPGDYSMAWRWRTEEGGKVFVFGYEARRRGSDVGPRRRPYGVWLFPRSVAAPDAEVRVEDRTPGGAPLL